MKTIDFPKPEVIPNNTGGQDAICNGNHWTWERTLERTTIWYDGGNQAFVIERFMHNQEIHDLIQSFEIGRTIGKDEGTKTEKFRLRQFLGI